MKIGFIGIKNFLQASTLEKFFTRLFQNCFGLHAILQRHIENYQKILFNNIEPAFLSPEAPLE